MTTVQVALPSGFGLYRHPDQDNAEKKNSVRGTDLKAQLTVEGKIDQCVTLQDPVVEAWILKKVPYPDELKSKTVVLITSTYYNNAGYAAGLTWLGGEVRVVPVWLGHMLAVRLNRLKGS